MVIRAVHSRIVTRAKVPGHVCSRSWHSHSVLQTPYLFYPDTQTPQLRTSKRQRGKKNLFSRLKSKQFPVPPLVVPRDNV